METSVSKSCKSSRSVNGNGNGNGNDLGTEQLVLLDWDDTVMPTSYLLSNIEYEVNRTTKRVTSFRFKSSGKEKVDEFRRNLRESGSAALRLLRTLYLHFVDSASGRNLLIVTNGVEEWLWNSLAITGTLCPIYRQIEQFLHDQSTQIIYARNLCLSHNYWKMASFDLILDRFLEQKRCHRINVITIGDQWTDHCSIEMTSTFRRHRGSVSHHQIKLYPDSDAHYMAVELNCIADLFIADDTILLHFAMNHDDGILIEFDGYQESQCPNSPDSESILLSIPCSESMAADNVMIQWSGFEGRPGIGIESNLLYWRQSVYM